MKKLQTKYYKPQKTKPQSPQRLSTHDLSFKLKKILLWFYCVRTCRRNICKWK